MASSYREDLYSRPANNAGPNTTRKEWRGNGVHLTFETRSYSSPGTSFSMLSTGSQTVPRVQGGGMLGAAFNLLNMLSPPPQSTRRGSRDADIDGMAYGDYTNDIFEEDKSSRHRRPTPPSANGAASQSRRPQRTSQQREKSPPPSETRPSGPRGNRSQRDEPFRTYSHTSAYAEDTSDDDEGYSQFRPPRGRASRTGSSNVRALEEEVYNLRQMKKDCDSRIAQVLRQPNRDPNLLQDLKSEARGYERAHRKALKILEETKANAARSSFEREAPRSPRRGTSFFDDFERFSTTRRSYHPVFSTSNDFRSGPSPFTFGGGQFAFGSSFDSIFNEFENTRAFHQHFFGIPHAAFTFSSGPRARPSFPTADSGPQFQQSPRFTSPVPPLSTQAPRSPPPNVLKTGEAQVLYQTYDKRWNDLNPADANIPYPTRGMKAAALCVRDTIWAPFVTSPISLWSEETVMRANAQAFFLGVVGLTPKYTEASGNVKMTYDPAGASPEKLKRLVDLLKKERHRWHSDRLGRRNGGAPGPNEALQRDERARAVFHSICDLMEVIQQ